MAKATLEYVHVIDKVTRKSIHCVGPTNRPKRVAAGMDINLDHDKYELAVSPEKEWYEGGVTLGEVLARSRTQPKLGDHEIVTGPDGLAHLLIVTRAENKDYRADLTFMCHCGALTETQVNDLEVAPEITCMQCIQW
jgi:hypothetical protein